MMFSSLLLQNRHNELLLKMRIKCSNFAVIFDIRELRVPGRSCGIVCMILSLAVFMQYCTVMDSQTQHDSI